MQSKHLQPLASIDTELAERLEKDAAFRRRFIRFWAQNEIASEIRTLRKERGLRQAEVAKLAQTGQSAISRIEKADYDSWSYKTLISIAEVLHARLRFRLEKIEDVISAHRHGAGDGDRVVDGAGTTSEAAEVRRGAETRDDDFEFSIGESSGKSIEMVM